MINDDWQIEPGKIHHRATPRFSAKWGTGQEVLETLNEGLSWSDEAADEEDGIHLYDFEWVKEVPSQARFEDLMLDAIAYIDRWITARM